MKKTLVIGASENPQRYSNMAIKALNRNGHQIVAIGGRPGIVDGVEIGTEKEKFDGIDTVTMYVGAGRQTDYYDYILDLSPNRVIFNPGTENPTFQKKLVASGVDCVEACTLVLLSIGEY